MPVMFSGETASDVWNFATKQLLALSDPITSRSGNTYELLHVLLSINNPKEKWVSNRIPEMSISFALAELICILNGNDTAKIINYWNSTLSRNAGNDDHYHGAYGFRIRHNFGVDQLEKAYCVLHNKPESKQTIILIWDPQKDLPKDDGAPSNADIPCNICSMLKIRNYKLEWTQIMRSNDIFLGLPYNFIQFTSMQEILAGWLKIGVGNYTHYSDSLHLYTRDCNKIGIGIDLYSKNADSLSVSKNVFDMIIKEIYNRMQTIVCTDIDEMKLGSISDPNSESEAYNNIMRIISAYAARKKGFLLLKEKIIKYCSNPLYIEIWSQWEKSQENGIPIKL